MTRFGSVLVAAVLFLQSGPAPLVVGALHGKSAPPCCQRAGTCSHHCSAHPMSCCTVPAPEPARGCTMRAERCHHAPDATLQVPDDPYVPERVMGAVVADLTATSSVAAILTQPGFWIDPPPSPPPRG